MKLHFQQITKGYALYSCNDHMQTLLRCLAESVMVVDASCAGFCGSQMADLQRLCTMVSKVRKQLCSNLKNIQRVTVLQADWKLTKLIQDIRATNIYRLTKSDFLRPRRSHIDLGFSTSGPRTTRGPQNTSNG